jgi:hypothetical protein
MVHTHHYYANVSNVLEIARNNVMSEIVKPGYEIVNREHTISLNMNHLFSQMLVPFSRDAEVDNTDSIGNGRVIDEAALQGVVDLLKELWVNSLIGSKGVEPISFVNQIKESLNNLFQRDDSTNAIVGDSQLDLATTRVVSLLKVTNELTPVISGGTRNTEMFDKLVSYAQLKSIIVYLTDSAQQSHIKEKGPIPAVSVVGVDTHVFTDGVWVLTPGNGVLPQVTSTGEVVNQFTDYDWDFPEGTTFSTLTTVVDSDQSEVRNDSRWYINIVHCSEIALVKGADNKYTVEVNYVAPGGDTGGGTGGGAPGGDSGFGAPNPFYADLITGTLHITGGFSGINNLTNSSYYNRNLNDGATDNNYLWVKETQGMSHFYNLQTSEHLSITGNKLEIMDSGDTIIYSHVLPLSVNVDSYSHFEYSHGTDELYFYTNINAGLNREY